MTPEEFISAAPFYNRVAIASFAPPPSIMRFCDHPKCKCETTWIRTGTERKTIQGTSPEIDLKCVAYECGHCKARSLGVVYELLDWSMDTPQFWTHKAVRKIGQTPPPEISVPAELNSRLGASARYYKNALICRQYNYGIAAMAYLRRVVDEHTDNMIDIMAELLKTHSVAPEEVAKLLEAKKAAQYKDKLQIASELIPDAVKPAGVNPFGQLYKFTSIGLHNKTDEECIKIFDDLREDFEYVFRNVHLQTEERKRFAERVQGRAGSTPV
jgi:hypothetical protein